MNWNKNKILMYVIIGIMTMVLVYVMFIQFRVVKETDTEEIEFMRETELRETLASYKSGVSEVEEELQDIQSRIDEYNKNEESEEATIELLEKEIQNANMKLGLTDVTGEGIILTIADTDGYSVRL